MVRGVLRRGGVRDDSAEHKGGGATSPLREEHRRTGSKACFGPAVRRIVEGETKVSKLPKLAGQQCDNSDLQASASSPPPPAVCVPRAARGRGGGVDSRAP